MLNYQKVSLILFEMNSNQKELNKSKTTLRMLEDANLDELVGVTSTCREWTHWDTDRTAV